jgi:hypothetical protein
MIGVLKNACNEITAGKYKLFLVYFCLWFVLEFTLTAEFF